MRLVSRTTEGGEEQEGGESQMMGVSELLPTGKVGDE